MRTFDSLKLGTITDHPTREALRKINDYLRSVSGALSKSVFPGQQPPANPVPSGTSSTPTPPNQNVPQPTQGDLLYGLNTGTWAKLPIGSSGSALIVSGGSPAWDSTGLTHTLLSTSHTDTVADSVIRGDLIVGNSTPKWARFPKGTSGTFLKQGANDPAWTAISSGDVSGLGALATLNSVGASTIDDRTRHLFWMASAWTDTAATPTSTSGSAPNTYAAIPMSGVSDMYLCATIILPADFTTGSASWKLHFANTSTSTADTRWVLYYRVVTSGASLTGSPDQTLGLTVAPPNVANQLQISEISTTVSGLSAGSHVRLTLARLPSDGADSNGSDMNFIGLQLAYTADS